MKLHFTRQGNGPAIILLHGLFGSLSNLAKLAKTLEPEFSVYLVDLRNHGRSPHAKQMNYALMAADIIELMDSENIEQAHLLGHSMGGKVAMQIALNHSKRVNKLIVADIAPVAYPRLHNPVLDGLSALQNTTLHSRQQADEILANHVAEPQVRTFLLKNLVKRENGYYGLRLNLPAILEHYQTLGQASYGKPFHGPTLFLKGMESDYIQSTHKETILSLFPNTKMQVISGTGHWLHSEKPDTFNRLSKQFLLNS